MDVVLNRDNALQQITVVLNSGADRTTKTKRITETVRCNAEFDYTHLLHHRLSTDS